jgi:aspartate racemase
MSASQSVLAPRQLQVPVRRFQKLETALQALAGYESALRDNARQRRSIGLPVTDQDQPEEALCLVPARSLQPPLALIGGMGPLAGAMAFRRACARFGDSRVLALYQACSMPDRSAIILSDDGPGARDMALRLADAVRFAADLAGAGPARCVVACNSAHYFWRRMEAGIPRGVRMISLVDSSVAALKSRPCRMALLLTTEGARAGQVFSAPFRDAAIAFEEPSSELNRLLMRTILEGVKALNERRAVELGNQFFEAILRTGRGYDCILAGCTELPLTIDLLRLHGSPAVAAFLSRARIVDPLEEALCRA